MRKKAVPFLYTASVLLCFAGFYLIRIGDLIAYNSHQENIGIIIVMSVPFIMSIILGISGSKGEWFYPIFSGLISYALPYIVLGSSHFTLFLMPMGLALLGLFIGMAIKKIYRKIERYKDN